VVQGTNGVGIQVRTNVPITSSISSRNNIRNNAVSGNTINGILDFVSAGTSNNAYYNNKASGPVLATNLIVPAGTPIRNWDKEAGAFPAATDNNGIIDPLDNINIRQV
jgi:hypothetical protein